MRCLLHIVLNRIVIFAFILLAISNCSRFDEDDKLSLERKIYNGNELRLDGYYYKILENENWYVIFLYRNGIFRSTWSFSPSEVKKNEEIFKSEIMVKNAASKMVWGVYQVSNDGIQLQCWYPSDGGALPVYALYGTISNDTTFCITRSQRLDETYIKSENDIYHFRQFSPKPDSVTHFIP